MVVVGNKRSCGGQEGMVKGADGEIVHTGRQ